jgi:two-component sensor histidine kinase
VEVIANVHDRLWRKEEVGLINLREFLGELCDHLRTSAPSHELVHDIEPVTVTTDQAVSLGILANELITNALKYAYPSGSGAVRLSIVALPTGELRLEVRDFGSGLADGFDSSGSQGLGTKVIKSLSRQLGGQADWRRAEPGTQFVLVFRPAAVLSRR